MADSQASDSQAHLNAPPAENSRRQFLDRPHPLSRTLARAEPNTAPLPSHLPSDEPRKHRPRTASSLDLSNPRRLNHDDDAYSDTGRTVTTVTTGSASATSMTPGTNSMRSERIESFINYMLQGSGVEDRIDFTALKKELFSTEGQAAASARTYNQRPVSDYVGNDGVEVRSGSNLANAIDIAEGYSRRRIIEEVEMDLNPGMRAQQKGKGVEGRSGEQIWSIDTRTTNPGPLETSVRSWRDTILSKSGNSGNSLKSIGSWNSTEPVAPPSSNIDKREVAPRFAARDTLSVAARGSHRLDEITRLEKRRAEPVYQEASSYGPTVVPSYRKSELPSSGFPQTGMTEYDDALEGRSSGATPSGTRSSVGVEYPEGLLDVGMASWEQQSSGGQRRSDGDGIAAPLPLRAQTGRQSMPDSQIRSLGDRYKDTLDRTGSPATLFRRMNSAPDGLRERYRAGQGMGSNAQMAQRRISEEYEKPHHRSDGWDGSSYARSADRTIALTEVSQRLASEGFPELHRALLFTPRTQNNQQTPSVGVLTATQLDALKSTIDSLLKELNLRNDTIKNLAEVAQKSEADAAGSAEAVARQRRERAHEVAVERKTTEQLCVALKQTMEQNGAMEEELVAARAEAKEYARTLNRTQKRLDEINKEYDRLKYNHASLLEQDEKQRERNERTLIAIAAQVRRNPAGSGLDRLTLGVVEAYEQKLENLREEVMRTRAERDEARLKALQHHPAHGARDSNGSGPSVPTSVVVPGSLEGGHSQSDPALAKTKANIISLEAEIAAMKVQTALTHQVQMMEKELQDTQALLSESQKEVELLKLQLLQTKPVEYLRKRKEVAQLQGGKHVTRQLIRKDKRSFKLQMAKIGDLTVDEARNILCHVCERLRVSDIQELASGVGAVGKVLRLVPQMQQFITKVDELVQKYDGKVSPQTNGKHDGGEPGKAGKKLPELLHVLTRWGDTNGDRERLSEFHRQVHQMLGIVKGEHSEERCVAQLREYLKSPPPLRPQAQAPVLPVDKSFEHMIVHFCNLFDVGSLKDVYPRLNELCLFWRTTNVGLARLQYAIGEKSLVTPEQILSTAAEIIESIAHVDEDRNEDTNVLRNARDTTMEAVDLPENLPSGERGAFKDYHIDERLYEARDVEINPPVRRPSMDPPESLYSRKQSDSLYTADRKSMPSSMWDPDQTTRLTSILERNKLDFGESILEAYENAPSVAITGAPSLEQSPDRIGPKQGTREPMYAFGGELRPLQQATAVGSGASRNASWERSESVAATAPTEIMPPDEKQKSSESRWVYPMPLVYHGPSSKTPTSERDDGWVPTVDPPMLAGNWDASSASATGPWSVTNVVRVKLPKQPLGSGLSAFGFDGPRDLDYTKERTLQTQENRTGKGNSKLRNEAPQSDADELMAEATVKLHHDQGSPASRNEDEALGLDERLATIDAATHEADELDEESMKEESLSRLRWYQPRRKRGGSSSRTSGTD